MMETHSGLASAAAKCTEQDKDSHCIIQKQSLKRVPYKTKVTLLDA